MKDYLLAFPALDGGLNLREEETALKGSESPRMENLWWEGGCLRSRPGQQYVTAELASAVGYAASEPFYDQVFLHISGKLYRFDLTAAPGASGFVALTEVYDGVPYDQGCFFRYGEHLYYKNRGGFFQIGYEPEGQVVYPVRKVTDLAYTPTILLSADPMSGSGDLYQPENRLTGRKRVKYARMEGAEVVRHTGDGVSRIFTLGTIRGVKAVYVADTLISPALYEVNETAGTLTFTTAPESGAEITAEVNTPLSRCKLPEGDVDEVCEVKVNGEIKSAETDYTVDLTLGAVTFTTAPTAEDNGLEIVYRKNNPDALQSVLSCRCGGVYGGGTQVCMVLGGCEAQPNAVFWNGNDDVSMNPGYFPMPFYNLCGDSAETVTGFGRQYGDLIVLKEGSIGKCGWDVETLNGRESIALSYTRINDKIGCDLPRTIALVGNNLVFASSSLGLCRLQSASAAYENNVAILSGKVAGSRERPGLLHDFAVSRNALCCYHAGRYWLCTNGHVYLWDTNLESAWFYFTGIAPVAWWAWGENLYHLNGQGRITRLEEFLMDYEAGIPKVYRFPRRHFSSYTYRKRVVWAILTFAQGARSHVHLRYRSDWETRDEAVDIQIQGASALAPRDLTERNLAVEEETTVAIRRPDCRNVRHFAMEVENSAPGEDLPLLSAQLIWRKGGRER